MYEKDLVKWGINLIWSPKALPEYTSVTSKSETHPMFLLYFCHYSCTQQPQIWACCMSPHYLYMHFIFPELL